MPGRKSKYSAETNSRIKLAIFDALNNSTRSMTIPDICAASIELKNLTSQKMSRVLNDLVEMGFVKKAQSPEKKRMVYALIDHVEDSNNVNLDDIY